MLRRLTLFWLVLFSLPGLAAFEGDWAAGDLYAFFGVARYAGNAEVLAAFAEGAEELGAARRAGLNTQSRLRALTNARNILVAEYSRSVYNAYLEACEREGIDPGTADQQQQMLAEYFRKYPNLRIDDHREEFPKFHRAKPVRTYSATDFTLHAVTEGMAVEMDTPLVEPIPAREEPSPACPLKLSKFRRLLLTLGVGAMLLVTAPSMDRNEAPPRPNERLSPEPQTSQPRPENKILPAAPESRPRVAEKTPAPPVTEPVPHGPPLLPKATPVPVTPAPPAAVVPPPVVIAPTPKPLPITPEGGAAGRGQTFRDRLGGSVRP